MMKIKHEKERVNTTRVILGCVAVAGILSMAVLAPNTLQSLQMFGIGGKRRWDKHYVPTVISRLVGQGYIEFQKTNKGTFARLTEKGILRLKQYELGDYSIPKPKRWDKKYRIVIFDIREYRRGVRDHLREHLFRVGFIRLQDSVWVYPYDCREFIILLKASFKIGKDILYIEADSIENDKWLKEHFQI